MANPKSKTLRLILGDQLNYTHSWFRRPDPSVTFVLMEMRQETDYARHHIQKICAFFAAMRAFAGWLESREHRVVYLRLDHPKNTHDLGTNLERIVEREGIERFEYMLPDEYRLSQQLEEIAGRLACETLVADSEHFLTSRDEVAQFFSGKKQWRMESFYRQMRREHNILMDGDQPVGGQWNYDVENRARYTGQTPIPKPKLFRNDVTEIALLLDSCGVETFGEINASRLIWPVTRPQSLAVLRHFTEELLPNFGTYQDAMTSSDWALFHSRLSFAINSKMLSPREVIDRAIGAWRERPEEIELSQIEGFVRQILGWREYMRGIYWAHMPAFGKMNYFNHTADLPHYYWDGKTNMACVAHAVNQTRSYAYAHHIQRLMITGNLALLAGVHPDAIDAWYLGVYIDAVEWVEMPNTRGMSQFADGGITASKPYVSTSNYIHGMSDYCTGCHYDRLKRHGDRACPFNSLHWDFYERHRERLQNNPRVGTMYRTWDRMESDERRRTLEQARQYRQELESL